MSGANTRWREPTSLLPLRWGTYLGRYLAGLLFIIGGAVQLQGSNTYTLDFLLIGATAHAVGWSIMPAQGWRRIVAVIPSSAIIWLLLTGPFSMWLLTITFVCWLIVRHRPARSYVTAIFPLANGLIVPQFFSEYSQMLPALSISLAVFVASAWLARVLAAGSARPKQQSLSNTG